MQMTSRPSLKSWASIGRSNRSLDKKKICGVKVLGLSAGPGKPRTGFAMYNTSAEVCGEEPHRCALPIQLLLDSTPGVRLTGPMPLCAPFFGLPSFQTGWYAFAEKLGEFSLRQDLPLTGVANCAATTSHG